MKKQRFASKRLVMQVMAPSAGDLRISLFLREAGGCFSTVCWQLSKAPIKSERRPVHTCGMSV